MHALWRFVFGNDSPVEIEIGPGTGTFLLAAAARAPHTNFFGIEHSHSRAARLAAAIDAQGLRNARVIAGDAACVVARLVSPYSVAAYHIYLATDVDDVFSLALKTLATCALAMEIERPQPRPRLTAFERKGLARGATIREATFVKPAEAAAVHTRSAAPITPAESPS